MLIVTLVVGVLFGLTLTGAFAATSSSGSFNMAANTNLKVTCPNALSNTGVAANSESVNCAPNPPPPTTAPPPTTTPPPPTTIPPTGSACVTSSPSGHCPFAAVPYITGIGDNTPYVDANVWTGNSAYHQTLTANAPNDWNIAVNVNTGFGGVQSFPNTGWQGGSEAVDASTAITSSWKVTMPTDTTKVAGWAAYDLWFNNWADEVMIQPDITANSDYDCTAAATATFNGTPWHLCLFGSERVWKIGADDSNHAAVNESAGSIDVLAMLKYMEANGYLPAASVWTAGSFGFEVCDTEGTDQTFAVNDFTWSQN